MTKVRYRAARAAENTGAGRAMFLRIVYCAHLNVFLGKLVGWGLVQGDRGLAVDIACFCLYCTWGLGVGPKGAGGGHRICIWFVFLLYSDHVFVLYLSCICIFKVGWLGVGPEGAGGGHRICICLVFLSCICLAFVLYLYF